MLAVRTRLVAKVCVQNARNLLRTTPSRFGRLLQLQANHATSSIRMLTTNNNSSKITTHSYSFSDDLINAGDAASRTAPNPDTQGQPSVQQINPYESITGRWVDGQLQGAGLLTYYDGSGAAVYNLEVVGRENRIFPYRRQTFTPLGPTDDATKYKSFTTYIQPRQYEHLTQGCSYDTLVKEAVFEGERNLDGSYRSGTLTYNQHLSVTGEFKHNQIHTGRGSVVYPNGVVYVGDVVAGQPDGYGVLHFKLGSAVQGVFSNGSRVNTHCVYTSQHGAVRVHTYRNQVSAGYNKRSPHKYSGPVQATSPIQKHGDGSIAYSDGRKLSGAFATNWLVNGSGVLKLKYGGEYTGSVVDGKRHGQGRLVQSDGRVWEGEFRHNRIHTGTGTYSVEGVGVVYEGSFVAGKLHGQGRVVNRSGSVYEGQFVAGHQISGSRTHVDGSVAQGRWQDGVLVEGKKTLPNGSVQEVFFGDKHLTQRRTAHPNGTVREGRWEDESLAEGKVTQHSAEVKVGTFRGNNLINGAVTKMNSEQVRYVKGMEVTTEQKTAESSVPRQANQSNSTHTVADINAESISAAPEITGVLQTPFSAVSDNSHVEIKHVSTVESKINIDTSKGKTSTSDVTPTETSHNIPTTHISNIRNTPLAAATVPPAQETPTTAASTPPSPTSSPGPGAATYADGSVYEGALLGRRREGLGTVTYPDGRSHFGMFKNDKFWYGEGVILLANGCTYEGEVRDGKWHGQGKFTFANGDVLSGEYRRGMCTVGRRVYASGMVREGLFNDKGKLVEGRTVDKNGAVWTGTFAEGRPHTGNGVLVFAQDVVCTGAFLNGYLQGTGSVVFSDGGGKSGEFRKGELFNGVRRKVLRDGSVVEMSVVEGVVCKETATTLTPTPPPTPTLAQVNEKIETMSEPEPASEVVEVSTPVYTPPRTPRPHSSPSEHVGYAGSYSLQPAVHSGPYKVKYIDGMKGTIEYADGSSYSGGWFEGLMHGKGALIFKNLHCLVGDFQDGRIHDGAGYCPLESGGVYEGFFKEGKVHGKGKYVDEDGFVFDGEVVSGDN